MRRHGTNSCYSMGCRRQVCKDAHAAYSRKRRRCNQDRRLESAATFQAWLVQVTMPRFTIRELAYKTGLTESHLNAIRSGRYGQLQRNTADALRPFMETP